MKRAKTPAAVVHLAIAMFAGAAIASSALAQHVHDPAAHAAPAATVSPGAAARQLVDFPAPMKEHTLANMRDHLLALAEIQGALARQEFDRAAELAEKRLGMSSLGLHGAHDLSR